MSAIEANIPGYKVTEELFRSEKKHLLRTSHEEQNKCGHQNPQYTRPTRLPPDSSADKPQPSSKQLSMSYKVCNLPSGSCQGQ